MRLRWENKTGDPRDDVLYVTHSNGDRVRYEFDYTDKWIFIYRRTLAGGLPDGMGHHVQHPVRAIPRRATV